MRTHAELAINAADVVSYGVDGYEELGRDVGRAVPAAEQLEHLDLARREAVRLAELGHRVFRDLIRYRFGPTCAGGDERGHDVDQVGDAQDVDDDVITIRVRAGVPYYELMTMEPGIWERNIYRINDPEYVNAHHNSCGTDMNIGFNETPIPQLMVFPCSADVVEGDMVPYTSWEDAIRLQEDICIIPCACRAASDTLGTRTPGCEERFGKETCIFMGDPGRYMIDHGYGRQVTSEECAFRSSRTTSTRAWFPR